MVTSGKLFPASGPLYTDPLLSMIGTSAALEILAVLCIWSSAKATLTTLTSTTNRA